MKVVLYALIGFSILGAVVGLADGLLDFGGQGIFTLMLVLAPAVMGGVAIVRKATFTRAMAGVSLLTLLITGMKTTEGFESTMMCAAAGIILAIVLLIKPARFGDDE